MVEGQMEIAAGRVCVPPEAGPVSTEIIVYGRKYAVIAFSGRDYMAEANTFMAANPTYGLLAEKDNTAYVALLKDKGVPATSAGVSE